MDSRKPSVDLGKELTCSICTELLYQPLTLLDCLHTYCGACLKEWFSFQAASAERAPTPPPDARIFTCPSCRSSVRDTRHNATVATLLDMFVAANPAKARSEEDKQELGERYKPGDQVLPKVKTRERTAEERRADEEDRRLLEEVREMSLREASAAAAAAGASGSTPPARSRRRGDSRSGDEWARSSREHRSMSRPPQTRDSSRQRRGENGGRSAAADQLSADGESRHHRRRRSESRHRQVEHQSSLRSLIGSQMSERDIEREIEEFARQIQEEGLLDGLDLDNIDLSRDDELSRRITEAYRRRQRGRSRQEQARRTNAGGNNGGASRPADPSPADSRLRPSSARPQSRHRAHSRSTSEVEDRSRPPLSASATLEVPERRTRRRTASASASGSRNATTAIMLPGIDTRPAARSQTDLPMRPYLTSDPAASVPNLGHGRSSSMNAMPVASQPVELPAHSTGNNASFASRLPQSNPTVAHGTAITTEVAELAATRVTRSHRPAELSVTGSLTASPTGSPTTTGQQRTRCQLYEEPTINCSRCNKSHIEYDLHYNCKICTDGQWNICIDCYRKGKGCLHWFGFGYGAWKKWEKRKQGDESIQMPHMLNAGRYLRPKSTSVGVDSRKTLTTEDPRSRLETGTFCAKCFAWTNDCFWRCDVCNEGDWGFCNDCVNQGRSCDHKLLPLAHEATNSGPQAVPRSPRSPGRPATATMLTGPQTSRIGPFRPLIFNTGCDVCKETIPPSQVRYHCFSCTSTLDPDASVGDYDICSPCYSQLEAQGRISTENGRSGWRRCLKGHRMVVVGFVEGKIGQWRSVERDLVGGRALRAEPVEMNDLSGLQKWSWHQGGEKLERLVTKDVSTTLPASLGSVASSYTQAFPPDGGAGPRAHAMWAWHPKPDAADELMFPRGADIGEIKDINGDWFFGTYMGAKGLFPAPYVRLEQSPYL